MLAIIRFVFTKPMCLYGHKTIFISFTLINTYQYCYYKLVSLFLSQTKK